MHQTHTIPWNSVARHVDFVRENPAYTEWGSSASHPTGLCVRTKDDARRAQDLNHFVRCLANAIRTFTLTEIAKVEEANGCRGMGLPLKADPNAPLFPDALLDLREHPFRLGEFQRNHNGANQLTRDHQRLDYWVQRAGGVDGYYTTSQGDLADSVKLLIQLGESEALLRLCRAPPHLRGIMSMGWGHSFGVDHVVYETLPRYLMLNIGYAVRQRAMAECLEAADRPTDPATGLPRGLSPKKQFTSLYEIGRMRRLVSGSFENYDFSTQFVQHRAFWSKYANNETDEGKVILEYTQRGGTAPFPIPDDPTVADPERAKQYLADCFRSLYLVNLLVMEREGCGSSSTTDSTDGPDAATIFWENEIAHALSETIAGLRTDYVEVKLPKGGEALVERFH